MAKVALALTKVTCADGTTDYNVGLNPNTNADDKVQAFVDAFKSVGNTASSTCHGYTQYDLRFLLSSLHFSLAASALRIMRYCLENQNAARFQ